MSKKSNILVNDVNLTNLHAKVKDIHNKEKGIISANASFVKWASELYKGQKNIHLNFTNPNTKKSNLSKEEYVILKDTVASAIYKKKITSFINVQILLPRTALRRRPHNIRIRHLRKENCNSNLTVDVTSL